MRNAHYAIRSGDARSDESATYHLWQRTLADRWPVSRAAFRHVAVESSAYWSGDALVANLAGEIVAWVATQTRLDPGAAAPRGQISAIVVDPSHRRQGIGRALLAAALESLREKGVSRVQLGGGASVYFWPGVPANLPGAVTFFEACGWRFTETSFDLVRALGSYATPPGVFERVERQVIQITVAEPSDVGAILAFEREHFPHWVRYFEQPIRSGEYHDVVVARDARGQVVGTALVLAPRSRWRRSSMVWTRLLGPKTGGVGALGVREDARGRGIGLALAARTTELLRDRGVATSYVGWTWLVDWYGKLGYRVWREYAMSWQDLTRMPAGP